jgi:hypothetical protein
VSAARPAEAGALRGRVAAALVHLAGRAGGDLPAEVALLAQIHGVGAGAWWATPLAPTDADLPLVRLAAALGLGPVEHLALALLDAVERDAVFARTVAALQAPLAGARPTLGLTTELLAPLAGSPAAALDALLDGRALATGAMVRLEDDRPAIEQRLALPPPIGAALRDVDAPPPGVTLGAGATAPIPLPPSVLAAAARHAAALGGGDRGLVVRAGSPAEGRAVCGAVAARLGRRAAFVEREPGPGLAAWLTARALVPVFVCDLGPGERRRLPGLVGYDGPVLALAGREGAVELDGMMATSWRVPVPGPRERHGLWAEALADPALAAEVAAAHRHGAGRIAQLARSAARVARLRGAARVERRDLRTAAWTAEGAVLGGLAEALPDDVPDDALVTTAPLRRDLAWLLERCRRREALGHGLGPAIRARQRPGVRALFVGPSGTGKTLAAGWLATRLGAPLYRVDLAAVTSKYIGETEKNLAQLLAHAEHEEIVLLFDEADSMFGKRTDVKEANDRFANAQTNFLLQRIESFDGIVVLTSNSKSRFDHAFTRRLDAVLEFPLPGPEERRALWCAHLGDAPGLDHVALNRLAATSDLVGGHVRNAVLAAEVVAQAAGRSIAYADLLVGLAAEYRKLGRSLPAELRDEEGPR